MAKLSAWLKTHLRHDPKSPKCHKDQLPFLPTPRRPITPTSFYTATNPFFKLPYDICALILSIAFGRTFHIDLELQEQKWQWRGANCSRDQDGWPCKGYPRAELWNDGCLKSAHSKSRNGYYYRPGIMGFLLSCKQAYAEGIHLLYATSRIFISSQSLLLHLGRLIPAVRLASITSLEVLLSVHDNPNGQHEPSFTLNNMATILSNIKTACPNLLSFAISFYLYSHDEHLLTGPTIPSLDAFYNSMQLRSMRIEVPHVTWRRLRHAMEEYQQHPPSRLRRAEQGFVRCGERWMGGKRGCRRGRRSGIRGRR